MVNERTNEAEEALEKLAAEAIPPVGGFHIAGGNS
jgi:hypothetical protein